MECRPFELRLAYSAGPALAGMESKRFQKIVLARGALLLLLALNFRCCVGGPCCHSRLQILVAIVWLEVLIENMAGGIVSAVLMMQPPQGAPQICWYLVNGRYFYATKPVRCRGLISITAREQVSVIACKYYSYVPDPP